MRDQQTKRPKSECIKMQPIDWMCIVLQGKMCGLPELNLTKFKVANIGSLASRQRLHKTGSVWNQHKIGTDKPCVYTRPGRSTLDRFSYAVPIGFTCQSDTVWNCTVAGWY